MIRLSGGLRSSLIVAGQSLRSHKLRTLLSILSLFLGVLSIVVVQAAAEAGRRATLAGSELALGKDGTLQIYVAPNGKSTPIIVDTVRGRADAVAVTTTQAIIGEPDSTPLNPGGMPIDQVMPDGVMAGPPPGGTFVICDARGVCVKRGDGPERQAPPGQAIELRLSAMSGDVRQFKPYVLESGQWLDFNGAPSLAPRIVVNKEAAKALTRYQVPAEMRVPGTIANPTPQIIGVVDDGMFEPTGYVRLDELLNWYPQTGLPQADLQVLLSPAASDVEHVLRARLVASGVPAEQIHMEPIRSRQTVAGQLALVNWIFLAMAGLVLLIGVAGILNVGLATVGERVEEFALRRAVGTPRSLLAGIVLVETMLTGLFTAGLAIGTAAAGLTWAGRFLDGRVPYVGNLDFPWQAGVAGVIAGLVAGLLGGLIPAIRAARIPIATVMRA